ncbi:MAG TPA: ABC transporter permease, partial [Acidimicrobiales bacterium]
MNLGLEVASGAIVAGTPILFAALGESFAESAGVVNLGTEGSMLVGALTAYAVAASSGNPWLGVLAGGLAGGLLSLLFAWFVLKRGSNQLASGLVILFLGLGLTSLFGVSYVSRDAPTLKVWDVPVLSSIPWIGDVFFKHDPLVYVAYALVPLTGWFLYRSRWGLLIRGVGERSEVVATYGHKVLFIQFASVVTGGFLAGVGGSHVSIAYANSWFENMIQGRGFVALAVVIFAARQPWKVAAGAYLFGAALALSPALQTRGYGTNQYLL